MAYDNGVLIERPNGNATLNDPALRKGQVGGIFGKHHPRGKTARRDARAATRGGRRGAGRFSPAR